MKKIISILLALLMLLPLFTVFSSCEEDEGTHTHTFEEGWSYSADTHWHAATCGHDVKGEETAHSYGEPSFTSDATKAVYTCSVCGYMEVRNHTHTFGEWECTQAPTIFEGGYRDRTCIYVGCPAAERETLEKIAVEAVIVAAYPQKLEYRAGESFDPTGIAVNAKGADGSLTDVTALVSFDKTTLAESDTKVTVSYEGKSADVEISVVGLTNHTHTCTGDWQVFTPATIFAQGQRYKQCSFPECTYRELDTIPQVSVTSIVIAQAPTRVEYCAGERFDATGIVVMAIGDDTLEYDVTALVTYDKSVLSVADSAVTVSFGDKTAQISITVKAVIGVSAAKDSANYTQTVVVEGIYVGISDEGSGDDKEMLLKDLSSDALISVRDVPYGSFPDYGYEYGDRVCMLAEVKRLTYNSAENSNQNKTYLEFSASNSAEILDTVISRGNNVSYSLESTPVVSSWAEMKAFFKGNIEAYTYVRISGEMWFNAYSGSDKILIHRLTMNANATGITSIKPDSKRAVGIRQNMLEANVPAATSMYFDTALGVVNSSTTKEWPAQGSKSVVLDFYAVVTAVNSVNYQLTILDPSWLLGRSEEVVTENYDNYDVVKEVAMAYYRQSTQIYYCDYWRNENISPEEATSQRPVSLDCSSFVNAVYYEAFGENVLGVSITSKQPKTEAFNDYANQYNGVRSDVVGHWYTSDYTTPEAQKALLADIYANLQVGDIVVRRYGAPSATEGTRGHTLIYIGNGQFLHSTGGINDSSKTDPDSVKDRASTNEYIFGTVLRLDAASLFEKETSSQYLFRSTTDSRVISFGIIRPLARGLTPNAKTQSRMAISGISMEKTVSCGLDKAVLPGSLITYTLELENHSTKSYTDIDFSEILPAHTSFVSGTEGLVLEGNRLSMKVDVAAMSKRAICWTVRVDENAAVGDKIVSDSTYFGGVDVFDTTNYVSKYSADQLAAVADKAREYASSTSIFGDPTQLANKIYAEALGVELGLGSSKDVMTSLFTSLTSTNTGINQNSDLLDMLVPTLYSGLDIKKTESFVSVHSESDFMLGDIILCRWNGENYRMFIYVGDGQFVQLDTQTCVVKLVDNGNENFTLDKNNDSARFYRKSITCQLRSYGKCVVLRPTMC